MPAPCQLELKLEMWTVMVTRVISAGRSAGRANRGGLGWDVLLLLTSALIHSTISVLMEASHLDE